MILLSKNEPQAKAYILKIVEARQAVADLANEFKADLEAISPDPVNYERVAELLAIDDDIKLVVQLFSSWKKKNKINLPLSLIRTNDQTAWPEEIKKAFASHWAAQRKSKDLSRYWNDKKKTFEPVALTKAEEKAIYAHFVEHVATEAKKRQYEFMSLQAELFNDYNTAPARIDSNTYQITPAKLNELFPHYAPLLSHEQKKLNKHKHGQGTFIYQVNKKKFVEQGPAPDIFI